MSLFYSKDDAGYAAEKAYEIHQKLQSGETSVIEANGNPIKIYRGTNGYFVSFNEDTRAIPLISPSSITSAIITQGQFFSDRVKLTLIFLASIITFDNTEGWTEPRFI